jgi:hypothetical protein
MPAHPGRRDARAPRQAECPRTQAGGTPAPRQVHAGATPAASALGTRASGAHASEDAPPVRRRAVTLAPRPGSRRRNARAQRIPHAGRTPAHPGGMPAHPGGRNAHAPRRTERPRTQAGGTPAHPGGSCLNLQPRSPRFSSRRSSQAHSSSVRRTSSAARLAANSSGVRHPTGA